MKKITLMMTLLMSLAISVSAQDTVRADGPKDSYYYNAWAEGDTLLKKMTSLNARYFIETAVAYHTADSLKVYGLSIMLNLYDNGRYPHDFIDTTMDSIYCYVRLYQPIGDSLRVVGEQRIHMRDTSVSYYLAMNKWNMSFPGEYVEPEPVYECFFDSPVTVIDSFYVGFAYDKNKYIYDSTGQTGQIVYPYRYDICHIGYLGRPDPELKEPVTTALRRALDSQIPGRTPGSWRFETSDINTGYNFMFAITEPQGGYPVDTTVIPVDTTTAGVSGVDMVGRYVSVSPNPAGDRATVLSSFGLTAIEAYDPQGRQLYAAPATGLRTTLDVSAWPRGAVLLHIHTPAGTAVKKLLLR